MTCGAHSVMFTVGHQQRSQVVERISMCMLRIFFAQLRGSDVSDLNTSSEVTIEAIGANMNIHNIDNAPACAQAGTCAIAPVTRSHVRLACCSLSLCVRAHEILQDAFAGQAAFMA